MLQLSGRPQPRNRRPARERFKDETHFLRTWFERPLMTGSVTPSGKFLANRMASAVDVRCPGPVIELGPGTGPVTEALLRKGVEQERLILVEYNHEFCGLLKRRFPRATIVEGDAYEAGEILSEVVREPAAALLSSLPLFTKPMAQRRRLLRSSLALMAQGAPFVQFTYAMVPPIPARGTDFVATPLERVWRNVPPARVWVYRGI